MSRENPPSSVSHNEGRLAGAPLLRIFWLALLLIAAVTILANLGDVRRIFDVYRTAQWQYVVLAALIYIAYMLNLSVFYRGVFRAAGIAGGGFAHWVLLTAANHFINKVSKTGGLGGIAVFLQDDGLRGTPPARVGTAYLIAYVLGYAGYFLALVLALSSLYLRDRLQSVEVLAVSLQLIVASAFGAVMLFGLRSQASLERLCRIALGAAITAGRYLRLPIKGEPVAIPAFAAQMYAALSHAYRHPTAYVAPAASTLGVQALSVLTLYSVARALNTDIGLEAALTGYAIALLFSMVTITPSGLGFVEASLSVLFISWDIDSASAIAVALGYRLFDFWLPVLSGLIAFTALRRTKSGP